MAREPLELRLRRTGGLAGLPMVSLVRTRDLESAEAQLVFDVLEDLDVATLARLEHPADAAPGAADTLHYDLRIRGTRREQTVRFREHQMPAELAPLIRVLMTRAQPGR